MRGNLKVCARCILDSRIPNIRFDEYGICNFCRVHDRLDKQFPLNEVGQQRLMQIIDSARTKGSNKKYDCVVALSGGTDSTYTLYTVKKFGLRPLAVHFDNGWNTEIANRNIKETVTKLNVDLEIVTTDWEEQRDLQIAFLKASVPDAEIPTDVAIHAVPYRVAARENIPYVFYGHSFRAEGIDPLRWTYMEGKYIKSVQKRFGKVELKSFPILTISDLLYFVFVKRIRFIPLLVYVDYRKEEAKKVLAEELGWSYYGGHHLESIYTHFVSVYVRWKKFGIDSRIIEYSALVRSSQMSRDEALKQLKENPLREDPSVYQQVLDKLGLTNRDFQEIMAEPPRSFMDYPTYYPIVRALKMPILIACKTNLLPQIFYEKYFNC